MRLVDSSDWGPACRFGDSHIYFLLTKLDKTDPISRHTLSSVTGIGEGSVRKIIEILKAWGAIIVKQTGIIISNQGCDLLRSIPIKLVDVKKSEYVIGAFQQGILVRGVGDKITNGMYQRDRGIIAGANGASVFMMRNGKLVMPKSWDMDTRDPDFAKELRDKGMTSEGDVIIISGASDPNIASISAISIALDLL